ncbi:MAG: DUF1573 domain-containing protein [Planctomycetota bacterium]
MTTITLTLLRVLILAAVIAPARASQDGGSPLIPVGTVHSRPAAGQEPNAKFERVFHSFSILEPGQSETTEFKFTNEGKGPLQILQVRPACACMVGGIVVNGQVYRLGDPIPPGAGGSIRVTIKATWTIGEKHSEVDVLTNDPQFPPTSAAPFGHVRLKIDATIIKIFEFLDSNSKELPENNLAFGSITSEKPRSTFITLRSAQSRPFTIQGIVPKDTKLPIDWAPVDALNGGPATAWKINITLPAGQAYGNFMKRFQVTTVPEALGVQFYISGHVRGLIEMTPAPQTGIRAGLISASQTPCGKITLKCNSELPLVIKNVRFCEFSDFKAVDGRYQISPGKVERRIDPRMSEFLTAAVSVAEDKASATIDITIKPGMPRGSLSAMLVFETGIPGGPETIATHVSAVVR